MTLPELDQLRRGARLLALDARLQHADGDRHAALENINAIFRLAEHAGSEPMLVSMLVAAAIDDVAVDTLQAVLESDPMAADETELVDLDGSVSYRRHFERSLRMEEAFGMSVFCDVAAGRMAIHQLMGEPVRPDLANLNLLAPLYRVFILPDDLASHREFLTRYRQAAKLPFHEAQPQWSELSNEVETQPGGVLTKLLIPAVVECAELAAQADARRRLARLAIASQRYRNAQGSDPARPEYLSPEWLTLIPSDPFDGQPMKAHRENGALTLYSIGPDMADNKGQPLADEPRTGEQFRRGDILFRLP
jgi:hypothetical protein